MQLFPALPEVVRGMFRRPEALAVCPPGGDSRERGMFLNQTEYYQLSLWDPEDRILMENFNKDNEKIDTALKENADAIATEAAARAEADAALLAQLRGENPYAVLADVTVAAETAQVDLDVSEIPFTDYLRVEFWISMPTEGMRTVFLRLNGNSAKNYYHTTTMQNNYQDTYLLAYTCGGTNLFQLNQPDAGSSVVCLYAAGNVQVSTAPCKWGELVTWNFAAESGQKIPAGTRIVLKGLRR